MSRRFLMMALGALALLAVLAATAVLQALLYIDP